MNIINRFKSSGDPIIICYGAIGSIPSDAHIVRIYGINSTVDFVGLTHFKICMIW